MPYRIRVVNTFPGGTKTGVTTWHLRRTGAAANPADDLAPIIGIVRSFYASLKTQFGAPYLWTFDGVITEVGTATPAVVGTAGWTEQGSAGGNTSSGPAGVGLVIGWRSSLATRRGRGRTFIAPLPSEKYQVDGTIDDAFLANVRGYANALVSSSLADVNGAVGVWSGLDQTFRDVVASKVNDRVAYLSTRRS